MGSFCSPGDGYYQIAGHLLARADERGLTDPGAGRWSIAELQLSEQHVDELYRWAKGEVMGTVSGPTGEHVYRWGLVALTLIAEITRRHAREGGSRTVWPDIATGDRFGASLSCLFEPTKNGKEHEPTEATTNALYAAAKHYNLRRSRTAERAYHIVNTVFLQFGLTVESYSGNVAEWLPVQGTSAMELLTGLSDDGLNRSESFVDLLRTMRRFVRRQGSEAELVDALKHSPWVLQEHRNTLLATLGKARREIGTNLAADDDLDRPTGPVFGTPLLTWKDDGPQLSVEIRTNGDWSAWTEPEYTIEADGGVKTYLSRQQVDGQPDQAYYRLRDGSISWTMPIDDALPTEFAPRVSRGGNAADVGVGSQPIYDPQQRVIVWSARGQQLSPTDQLDPWKAYTVLLHADDGFDYSGVDATDQPTERRWRPDVRLLDTNDQPDSLQLVHLPPDWPADLRVMDDQGECVWVPVQGEVQKHQHWIDEVVIRQVEAVKPDEEPLMTISTPPGVTLEALVVDDQPTTFEAEGPREYWFLGPAPTIEHEQVTDRINVRYTVRHEGEERSRIRAIWLFMDADALFRPQRGSRVRGKYQRLDPSAVVEGLRPAWTNLVCWRGPGVEDQEVELRAGQRSLTYGSLQAGRVAFRLAADAVGLGEQLALWADGQPGRELGRVVRTRPLPAHRRGDDLELQTKVALTANHQALWWAPAKDGSGVYPSEVVSAGPHPDGGYRCLAEWPNELGDCVPVVVALARKNGGSFELMADEVWCRADWAKHMGVQDSGIRPDHLAHALKFGLPLYWAANLHQGIRQRMQEPGGVLHALFDAQAPLPPLRGEDAALIALLFDIAEFQMDPQQWTDKQVDALVTAGDCPATWTALFHHFPDWAAIWFWRWLSTAPGTGSALDFLTNLATGGADEPPDHSRFRDDLRQLKESREQWQALTH